MTRKRKPVSPREMLAEEFLEPLGLSNYRLAKEIGVPAQRIGEIVAGGRARNDWFAAKLVRWQNGRMKTTLDLPDELVRRIKIEAAQSDRKLKDLVAQLLEAGLRASRNDGAAAALPKPVKRRRGGPLTADAIEAAIAAGRE